MNHKTPADARVASPLARFLSATGSSRMNRVRNRWRRYVTALWHRRFFGALGPGTVIYGNCILENTEYVTIGARTTVRQGTRLEVALHGQAWEPALSIGDDVNIEQNVHIVCHDRVRIGNNVSITGCCAIVDITHPHAAAATGAKVGNVIDDTRSQVTIGDNAFIGFGSIILPNVSIGRNAYIGAGSVVTADVPEGAVAAGAPAKILRYLAG